MPMSSSEPAALPVIQRMFSEATLLAVAGSVTSIGVTSVARLGPVEASGT